jgi:putative NADH-flavin reductase
MDLTFTVIGLGRIGAIVARELVERGHRVVGIGKSADESTSIPGRYDVHRCDIDDEARMIALMAGSDAVFNAISPNLASPGTYGSQIEAVIRETKAAGVPRLLSIIGSSSVLVNTGVKLAETDYFDETNRVFYLNICASEEIYFQERELDWACITPPAFMEDFEPVLRTYRKRYDGHLLAIDDESPRYFEVSWISLTDFAYACADELETPTAHHQRVSIGY